MRPRSNPVAVTKPHYQRHRGVWWMLDPIGCGLVRHVALSGSPYAPRKERQPAGGRDVLRAG